MLDWLRYFPLSLRTAGVEPVTPVGPYFSRLRKQQWVMGDNIFHLDIPWSNSVVGAESYATKVLTPKSPDNFNILEHQWSSIGLDNNTLRRWKHGHFFLREWLFVGPWFSGAQSQLFLSGSLIEQKNRDDFKGASFFHPRVFETVIADYLNSYYGHEKSGSKPSYRGPLNWKILPISSSIKAVCCDIHFIGNTSKDSPKLLRQIFFPITDNQFIRLHFDFGGTLVYQKDRLDAVNMFELTDSIIKSFSLDVGMHTQNSWDDVKIQCPDMSLSLEFGELKWPVKPDDIGKVQAEEIKEADILKIDNVENE